MTNPVKRFVAGAVCPRCNQMDTLRMYRDEEREHRECAKCDFTDSMRLDGEADTPEIETRVNQDAKPLAEGAQPLLFVPNPSTKKES